MNNVSSRNAPNRPSTPVKTSWFEFLLSPSLLEEHLSKNNADPSATELIIQFMTNISPSTAAEQNHAVTVSYTPTSPPSISMIQNINLTNQDVENAVPKATSENEPESKKSLALKLLALRVAAFLKWDLNLLEKKLPLPLQEKLITHLQKLVSSSRDDISDAKEDFSTKSDNLFANILYNRWTLRAVIHSSYPIRGQKGLTVQIPGQIDPTSVPQDIMELLIRKVCDQSEHACKFLEEVLKENQSVRMPVLNSFGLISEESHEPKHSWENGLILNVDEVICQVSYDLGCYYFYQEQYHKAAEEFMQSSSLYSKLKDTLYCKINEVKLKGYCTASNHLMKQQSSSIITSLTEKLQLSAVNGYKDTINILIEDNMKKEISLSLRDRLEMELLQKGEQVSNIYYKVISMNAIRRIIAGQLVNMNFQLALRNNENMIIDTITEAIKSLFPSLSTLEKTSVKNFVRLLYHLSSSIACKLKSNDVMKLIFDQKEIDCMYDSSSEMENKSDAYSDKQNFTEEPAVKVGQLERELLSAASSPEAIRSLVKQLQPISVAKPLWTLNHKWELPRPLAALVRNVQSPESVYILLAKAAELRTIKDYARNRELYRMVQDEVKNVCPRLAWLIGWELLHTDLLETIEMPVYKLQVHKQCQDIILKAKACIKAYCQERDTHPDLFLVDLCVVVLLNLHDWDTLHEMEIRQDSFTELSNLLAGVCRDICANKGSRTCARDLWDTVLPIFSSTGNQHKRTSSGMMKEMQRDMSRGMSRSSFLQFVTKLTDTLVLTVVISCLSRIFNILKDDPKSEVFLEYSVLWPSVITNSNMYGVQMITDTLHEILQYALSVHPTHSSWLKTRGDFMYAQNHYAAAMKNYLSAAMVSSNYFSQPLPRVLFDDAQFNHMIHCCTKLQCHTQAAILGQCLEEPCYSTMFKELGEKGCNDNCDTLYPCIWDVTLLEYLINLHARRGEIDRRQLAVHLIGQLELNSNNNEEIQHEATNIRKGRFSRAIAKQYL